MGALDRKEILMLHALICMKDPAPVTAFTAVSNAPKILYGTFNEQYSPVLKYIKTDLIRKGVLAYCEDIWPSSSKSTKLERLIFHLPPEFHAYVPSPFSELKKLTGPGEISQRRVREKLQEIFAVVESPNNHTLQLNQGRFVIGKMPFTANLFSKWQRWEWAWKFNPNLENSFKYDHPVTPMRVLEYFFSLLGPDEWIKPQELESIFTLFGDDGKKRDVAEIVQQGWEMGFFARHSLQGETWFRNTRLPFDIPESPIYKEYLNPEKKEHVVIRLDQIPIEALDLISQIALFRIEKGDLLALPDTIRIGRNLNLIENDPFLSWLMTKSTLFNDVFQMMKERHGHQIIHHHLLIAKIKQLGLKAALEKRLADTPVVFLPDDYMVFPKQLLSQVESIVMQHGFAVRTVDAQPT